MSWSVAYTRTFLKEMARLPKSVRIRVESIAFGEAIQKDAFLGGKTQKLAGYDTFYKIRVGDYRIGLEIILSQERINFQRVLHRREIYRKFP